MGDISLADVARALDAMLDDQMTGQARIAAHLVAAAEAAGHGAERVIETLTDVVSNTVLDECWITDGEGLAYITTVRNADGAPVPFRFSPDPAEQPQASAFHPLLSSDPQSDDVVAQGAQVREIDNEVFKYVGVAGVDRRRIVQVGNALAFEEQALQSGVYTSPVMTAVLAAFSEPDLLASARTGEYAEIRSVFEGLLGQQMIVQATLAACFVAAAEAAGWSAGEIDARLRRIVRSSPIGEIHVATQGGDVLHTSLPSRPAAAADLPHAADPGRIGHDTTRVVEHPVAERAADGAIWKYVSVAAADTPRFVQVGLPIADSSPVSPRFGAKLPG
ncbi:MAG: hypothetical protein F4018_12445 [Acidobacteria bacterium]|nr:hypothetical protein [Acidobacteriota bacterium]MYH32117.1 hypothetical protein [Acidobacteriota bacterium]MYK89072.1 hypothetical protein [Acidobacteriota bacterium]